MGNCVYCSESAGWFRSVHRQCDDANRAARLELVRATAEWLAGKPDATDVVPLAQATRRIVAQGYLDEETARVLGREGLYAALERYLEDGLLSKREEERLFAAADALGIDTDFLWKHPRMKRFVGAGIIRRVLEGEPWESPWQPEEFGLILDADEQILWVEAGVSLHEPKTSRSYTGASSGFSIRLARGVYYRVGQFKGHPIDQTSIVEVARGTLAFTNQQIYFVSPIEGFKLPYRKLAAITPFEDGIGLQRDGVSAKPRYVHGGDGWLLYNLAMNFAERDRAWRHN